MSARIVQEFYLAYYGRPADPAGLDFWVGQLAGGNDFTPLVNAFGTSAEATELFAGQTDSQKINAIFQQLFGRDADAAGLAFYLNGVTTGAFTFQDVSRRVLDGAQNEDRTIIENKQAVAEAFTQALRDDADAAAEYSGLAATTTVKALIATVDATPASVSAAQAQVTTITGTTTFMLTTGADDFPGTAGRDKFVGVVSGLASAATLNATDKIDGGAGNDRLDLTMSVNWAGFSSGSVKNVETINLTNAATNTLSFDATGTSGVNKVAVTGTSGSINLTNLPTGVKAIDLNGLKPSTGVQVFSSEFASGVAEITGTTDALNLTLNGVGNAPSPTATDFRDLVVATQRFETINATVTDTSFVRFADAGGTATALTTLNILGSKDVTISRVNPALEKFNSEASTGNVTVVLSTATEGTTALTSAKFGSGNDKVTIHSAGTAPNATLSGGAGTDILTLTAAGSASEYTLSGFETLALSTVTAATTISGAKVSDLTTITSRHDTAGAVTFVGMGARDLVFSAAGSDSSGSPRSEITAAAGTIASDQSGTSTINLSASALSVSTGAAQPANADYTLSKSSAVTLNVGQFVNANGVAITAAEAKTATINVATGKNTQGVEQTTFGSTVTVAKADTVNVNAQGSIASLDIQAVKAKNVSIVNGGTAATNVILNTPEATTLTLTSGEAFSLANGTDLRKVQVLEVAANKGHTDLSYNDALAAARTFESVSSVTLSGTGTSSTSLSAITLPTLGKTGAVGTGNAYDLSVVATGLKGGLTIADLQTGDGYSVSLNVKGVTGDVTVTDNIGVGESLKNITIDAAGTGGVVTIGRLEATGTVTLLGSGAKQIVLGNSGLTVKAKDAVIDLSGTTVASTVTTGSAGSSFDISSSLDLKLHGLQAAGTHTINARSTATALDVKIQGGLNDETVVINGGANLTSLKVSGALGAGTDTVTVGSITKASTIDLRGLTGYENSTITGGAGSDTIFGGEGVDYIIAGRGTNVLSGGDGADVFLFNAGDSIHSSVNTINDFSKSQGDKIVYGAADISAMEAGSFTSGTTTVTLTAEGVATFAGTSTNFDTVLEIAALLGGTNNSAQDDNNVANNAAGKSAFFRLGSDTFLFISDGNTANGEGDTVIKLVGVSLPAAGDSISFGTAGTSDLSVTGISGFGA